MTILSFSIEDGTVYIIWCHFIVQMTWFIFWVLTNYQTSFSPFSNQVKTIPPIIISLTPCRRVVWWVYSVLRWNSCHYLVKRPYIEKI